MMKTTLLFPTPLWEIPKVGVEKQPLLDFVKYVREEDPNGRVSSNEGGWQSWDFEEQVCDTNPLKDIKDAILRHAYAVCDEWAFKDYILNETLTKEFHTINAKGKSKILDYFVDTEIKKI